MKCSNPECQKEIPEGFKFCPNCGTQVTASEVPLGPGGPEVIVDKWQ